MSNEHYTAWVTTDRSALENDYCDVTVLADEEIGERDGRPVWSSTGNPLFYAETTVHVDDDADSQDQAKELLKAAGWRVVGDWEGVTTGYIATVERVGDDEEGGESAADTLREILGVMGPHDSDIEDSEERDNLISAVERGHVHRESVADEDDFVRVVEYDVPGSDETRYALHRVQGDGLAYIHDSGDRGPVEAAYERAVRELVEDSGYEFERTDVSVTA